MSNIDDSLKGMDSELGKDLKIRGIKIEHFRGVPNDISLNFSIRDKAESALIFGDNGIGKSTIVDAIEFVTQGSVQGSVSGNSREWLYNSISLTSDGQASVDLFLNDDSHYSASIYKDYEEGVVKKDGGFVKAFRYAPFILRRQDILSFWGLPNEQNLRFFQVC